jgi:PglZ domain
MATSLRKRIHMLVRGVLDSYDGAWMVWCDPSGEWAPLLTQVSEDSRMGKFDLVTITERTTDELGSPLDRRVVQERLDSGGRFMLLVPAPPDSLGWLWAQSLLAEQTYSRSLREQLLEWGWRPQSLTITPEGLAAMARRQLDVDPAEWGGDGPAPDPGLLIRLLAGAIDPDAENRHELELTIEAAGLPPLEPEGLDRWRVRAIASLITTQAHEQVPRLLPEGNEFVIGHEYRAFALDLLNRWCDSRGLQSDLYKGILEADRVANLASAVGGAPLRGGPFVSRAAEHAVFAAVCSRLAEKSGRDLLDSLAAMGDDITRRDEGIWGKDCRHPQAIPWGELLRLSRAARTLHEARAAEAWPNVQAAITWYVEGGWRIDFAGEEISRTLNTPASELIKLVAPLREAYRGGAERYMMQWSKLWTEAGCPPSSLPSVGEWMREQLHDGRHTAILMLDALRYDLGARLVEKVNEREGSQRATAHAAHAPLPSVTALGMGMALPIPESELVAKLSKGRWELYERGRTKANLSEALERRKWWQSFGRVTPDALIALSAVQSGTLPEASAHCGRLVIYDDAIDKQGHSEELEEMGAHELLDRYASAIGQLRDAGWLRIVIATDHGFIHWHKGPGTEAQLPTKNPTWESRRAAAYATRTKLTGPQQLAPGGEWQVAFPSGATSFSAYGAQGYFHGGASLQEWIIPCIHIEWPVEAQPVAVLLDPLPQILSLRPRVTLQVELVGSMLFENALPREVVVVIRDAESGDVVFRSAQEHLAPDRREVPVALQYTGVAIERDAAVRIEVRDARTDEVLTTGESVMKTAGDEWS